MASDSVVGFVGLGNMGCPMVARLVRAGFDVRAFDVSSSAQAKAGEAGAAVVSDLGALASGAAVVILMLPDSDAVSSVLEDERLRRSLDRGVIVVDMGSSEPLRTRDWAGVLAQEGIRFIDAPVSGGVAGAIDGTLTLMVGGTDGEVGEAKRVLSELGRVVRTGAVGSGHAAKALNNLLSATHLLATSEAMEAGRRFGIEEDVLLDVFNHSSGRSGSTEVKWPKFVASASFDSGFALRLMLKDMLIAVRLAEGFGTEVQLGSVAAAIWGQAAGDVDSMADHTEIARWVRNKTSS